MAGLAWVINHNRLSASGNLYYSYFCLFILNFFGIEKVEVVSADQMALDYEKSIKDAERQIEKISTR